MALAARQEADGSVSFRQTSGDLNPGEVWYNGPVCYEDDGLTLKMLWDDTIPGPRCLTAEEEKVWAAEIKTEEIYAEQELRAMTLLGFGMPRQGFDLMEELYAVILKPSARNNIDETDTPMWWGLRELRGDRNTLLNGLQAWIDDPAKTAEDILAFDVAGWSGWTIARP